MWFGRSIKEPLARYYKVLINELLSHVLSMDFFFQVLALPGLVWKQLTGEAISWNEDFPAVDSVLVSNTNISIM